ncbi:MAG: TerB family tellurite resistance protein [Candidatus Krumholzibacteria bacterium]|nr:TerB family tellurite resistance protein [Candidatus Krumholzibacteria bacterium]
MAILDWLGLGKDEEAGTDSTAAASSKQTDTVRKIVKELEGLGEERARYIASFAYILGRVANADMDISDDETRAMEQVVVEQGGIPQEQAVVVVHMAKTHNQLFGGTENFLITREFDQMATREQKLALLDCLLAVSASDESISSDENVEIRKIADELHLSQRDFVNARSRYREHLDILKKREKS